MPKHINEPNLPRRFERVRLEDMTARELAEALNTQRSRVRILSNHRHNLSRALAEAEEELDKDQAIILRLKIEKGARHGLG